MPDPELCVADALSDLSLSVLNRDIVRFGKKKGMDAMRIDFNLKLSALSDLVRKLECNCPDADACFAAREIVLGIEDDANGQAFQREDVTADSLSRESLVLRGPKKAVDWFVDHVQVCFDDRDGFVDDEELEIDGGDIADQNQILFLLSSVFDFRQLKERGTKYLREYMRRPHALQVLKEIDNIIIRKRLFVSRLRLPENGERSAVQKSLHFHTVEFLRATLVRQMLDAVLILHNQKDSR